MQHLRHPLLPPGGAGNFLLNLAGSVLPMVVAVLALPVLLHAAGTERLGALAIVWALIGYLGLLDLGLSRVLTRRIAQAPDDAGVAAETALALRIAWGQAAVLMPLALLAAWAIRPEWLAPRADPALLAELGASLWIVLPTLPLVLASGLLRGLLEGRQHFALANGLRVVFGSWSFAAPAIVAALGEATLPALVCAVAAGRVLALPAHWWAVRSVTPRVATPLPRVALGPLLREGGWLTISGVVSPLMVTLDRLAIGALLTLAAAAYYAVPQEVALRLLLVPTALAATLFPMLAQAHDLPTRRDTLMRRSVLAALAVSLPPCLLFGALAEPGLAVWMGADFAHASAPVAAIFACGLLANSVAQIPFAALQAGGRADVAARLHLAELPLFLAALWLLTREWGLPGAALAWSLRTLADALLLFLLAHRLGLGRPLLAVLPALGSGLALTVATAATVIAAPLPWRWPLLTIILLAGAVLSWRWAADARGSAAPA